jgi:peptidoglycan-associated lipoprotein
MNSKLLGKFATFAFVLTLALTGCAKKHVAKNTPLPPAAPAAPTASFNASPSTIQPGQTAQLSWSTTNATEINITGLGVVPASGSRSVTPTESETYNLTAKGPGGTADASARVTVLAVQAARNNDAFNKRVAESVRDVYFDYDKYVVRDDQQPITQADADFLNQHPEVSIVIEGHCDDRGSEEYNLALGDQRASAVKESLVKMGISAERIHTVSYGKERPFCSEDNDKCWSENRRDHLVASVSH